MEDDNQKNQNFITEIAKYFMTFLETDFKKRRLPKRHTNQKSVKGSRVGVDIEKYPAMKKILLSNFFKGFSNGEISIQKGRYKHVLPDSLQGLINSEIEKIDSKEFNQTILNIANELKRILNNLEEYDLVSEEALEFAKKNITKGCFLGFLQIVEGPLARAGALDENAKYQIESELIDAIFESSQSGFLDLCKDVLQKKLDVASIEKKLKVVFDLSEIRETLKGFFRELKVNDFFDDLYELFRNNAIFDKTELYFYLYEIMYDKDSFPIFYIPITVTRNQESSFLIQFDKRIFINTKAINYVVQQFNQQTSNNTSLAGAFDRIIYVESEQNIDLKLKSVISQIAHFFQFSGELSADHEYQRQENLLAALSNRSYLYLFDKSDEALINDYETIIDNDMIKGIFSNLINGFIGENPVSIIRDIDDDWASQDSVAKLVFESPIPLNEEQKRVLSASEKKDCSYMILEGPPGTGKSHTITAIICKALLEEKSVLVLSDKKEALDVVEDKITQTLNRIRRDEGFQNPILRFGKSGNKFSKIVQGQTVEKIKEHYRIYKSKYDQYESLHDNRIEGLKQSISQFIEVGSGLKMSEIIRSVKDEVEYDGWNWFEGVSEIPKNCLDDILKLKRLISKFKNDLNAICSINEVNRENLSCLKIAREQLGIISTNKKEFDLKQNVDMLNVFKNQQNKNLSDSLVDVFKRTEKLASRERKFGIAGGLNSFSQLKGSDIQPVISNYLNIRTSCIEAIEYLNQNQVNTSIFSFFKLPENTSYSNTYEQIQNFKDELNSIKLPLFGFLFSRKKFNNAVNNFERDFLYYKYNTSSGKVKGLETVLEVMNFIAKKTNNNRSGQFKSDVFQTLVLWSQNEDEFKEIFSSIDLLGKSMGESRSAELLPVSQYQWADHCIRLQYAISQLRACRESLESTTFQIAFEYDNILFGDEDQNLTNRINEYLQHLQQLIDVEEEFNFIKEFVASNDRLANNLGLDIQNQRISEIDSVLIKRSDEEIESYMRCIHRNDSIRKQFQSIPDDSFADSIDEIQQLTAAKMAHFLDGRVLDYIESNASDVNTLKLILRKKQKFPKELFEKLKKAFPCIIAGIRDYAEYIPMSENIFDLIIIDEASQVSIAQALPALIRGKKVIVLGDDKQFSNVKSQNASSLINNTFRSRVRNSFLESLQNDNQKDLFLTKVTENFDIKNSILKFVKFIRNYECVLRKHFRCYPEIISYSNKYFYGGYLQCMKIRGCSIEDVIKFDVLDMQGMASSYKNVNEQEAEFILFKLEEFASNNDQRSIGIISPHRDQVKYLTEKIYQLRCKDQLLQTNKLKIMTFDTCQGEERDYIFYSMVATEEKDRLNWIFIKSLDDVDIEAEGKIRAQRLNVGFSRAKDTIHLVLSKPIESFSGEIRNALLHYRNELEIGNKKVFGGTDKNSPMEEEIQHYFYETQFYKENTNDIEFIPQFPIGEYLKQLDKSYTHPFYKVDFLLIYKDEKIILEYDGFKEHFVNLQEADALNFDHYMSDDDVYRQKVLEGYGYKFLRINKFNIGDNPIETLDRRLDDLLKKNSKNLIQSLHDGIDLIRRGELRYCEGCHKTIKGEYFPYKSRELCFECYEKVSGKTLHSFRNTINFKKKYGSVDSYLKAHTKTAPKSADTTTKAPSQDKEAILTDCISKNRRIEISYKPQHGYTTIRTIKPKKIIGNLVTAHCYLRNEERLFYISKMKIIRSID